MSAQTDGRRVAPATAVPEITAALAASPAPIVPPTGDSALSVPALAPDVDTLSAALAYAGAGWFVGPLARGTKHSVLVEGRPLLVSAAVADGIVWGIPEDRAHVVVRDNAKIETDYSVFSTSDRVAVKGTMRVGFGFVHQAAVVKVALSTAA